MFTRRSIFRFASIEAFFFDSKRNETVKDGCSHGAKRLPRFVRNDILSFRLSTLLDADVSLLFSVCKFSVFKTRLCFGTVFIVENSELIELFYWSKMMFDDSSDDDLDILICATALYVASKIGEEARVQAARKKRSIQMQKWKSNRVCNKNVCIWGVDTSSCTCPCHIWLFFETY